MSPNGSSPTPRPTHAYLNELEPNVYVEGVYSTRNCQKGMTKTGKAYLKCLLSDRSGQKAARMWNAPEQLFDVLPTDGFVWIAGQTQAYQGELQIIIQEIEPRQPAAHELKDLIPHTRHDIGQMFAELTAILDSLEHPGIKALARVYLDDQALMTAFREAPAAMTLHHAFVGGLLEHTLSLLKLAGVVLPLYPQINRDIVLMGLFIHDLGKCRELTWETGFGYSDEGQLLGHIAIGSLWLAEKSAALRAGGVELPPHAVMVLQHIILSHHGKPEFGALKLPSTPEAILVNLLDNTDAKIQMALSASREEGGSGHDLGGNFTEKVWALENVRLFRPDPLATPEAGNPASPEAAHAAPQPSKPAQPTAPRANPPVSAPRPAAPRPGPATQNRGPIPGSNILGNLDGKGGLGGLERRDR